MRVLLFTPLDEFHVSGSFGCVLMFPASFAGVIVRVRMFSMRGWFLDPSVSFAQPFASTVSGSGGFDSIGRILMVSTLSSAVSMSYPALGMSMYMLDLSAWFPQPFSLSGRPLAALSGEFGRFCSFRLVLMVSTSSGGVSVSFAMLCMPVCTFDVSEWFPQLFGSSECALTIFAVCAESSPSDFG